MTPRLFLVVPENHADDHIVACTKAACQAADCASIIVGKSTGLDVIAALQALNLAVLLKDAEPEEVQRRKADGLLLSSLESLADARNTLKAESLGLIAGVSRHDAMEATEAGVDFVCFTPTKQYGGEPIIGWWQAVTQVPAVAYDQVSDASLKAQNPDFIRPDDTMWHSPEAAAKVVTELMAKWTA